MRTAMKRQLELGDTTFDFSVQFQTDAETMPIEGPGKEWSETESPFIKVATIKVLQQTFDNEAQNEFGENPSFSPWHSLSEHRPLGSINRARRVIYPFISRFRHQKNNVPVKEPTSWEV